MLPLLVAACTRTHPPPVAAGASTADVPSTSAAGALLSSHSLRPHPQWVEGAEEPTFRLAFWAPNSWAQFVVTWGWRGTLADDMLYWEEGPFPLTSESTEALWTLRAPPEHALVDHRIVKVFTEFDGQGLDGTSGFITNTDGYVFAGLDGRLHYKNGAEAGALQLLLSPDGGDTLPPLEGMEAPDEWLALTVDGAPSEGGGR